VSHSHNHCCHVTVTIRYILIVVVVDAAVNIIKVFSVATETHLSCNKIFRTYVNSSKYTRGLRKWLPELNCGNFVIVGLNTKLLLAQHIPLLSHTG
jgi:hypothetical protein